MKKFFENAKKTVPVLSFILISTFFSAVCFCGCAKNTQYFEYDYYGVMNSDAVLKIYSQGDEKEDEGRFSELAEKVKNLLSDIENSLSAELENSCVSRFNNAAAGEKVEIDLYAYEVFQKAKSIYEMTAGAYNPAVYYSIRAYGFNTGGGLPQSAEDLPGDADIDVYKDLSEHFGEIGASEEEGGYFFVKPDYTALYEGDELSLKIDLGGIGKGYAADKVNALIDEYGFDYGYFNFGSSSIAFKKYPDKSSQYNLQLTNPRKDKNYSQSYLTSAVGDECVSTSGDSNNYFMLDSDGDGVEERFCHIIDPFTGKPVQKGIISATVIGGKAVENDALTTAIMAMEAGQAVEFINSKLSDRRVVFAFEDGSGLWFYTNMPGGAFSVDDSRYKAYQPSGGADVP